MTGRFRSGRLPNLPPDGILTEIPVGMLPSAKVTVGSLRALPLFAELGEASLRQLLELGRTLRLATHAPVSASRVTDTERYCFVVDGVIGVTVGTPGGVTGEGRFLGYFTAGDCFSDGFLGIPVAENAERIDCVAVGSSLLFDVNLSNLSEFLSSHPGFHGKLVDSLRSARRQFLADQEPGPQVVQDFVLRQGFINSGRLRVGNLSHCLDCGKCEAACAARHGGTPRMARTRVALGCLAFPVTCQTCRDKPCLAVCSFGGLVHDEETSEVRISERCGGCGACVEACPYGAIRMIQAPYTVADFPDPIPNSNVSGMTNVDRLYVAGDVAGSALIRLAINDAVRAVNAIPTRSGPLPADVVDVAIVGAGPAGLSAAMRCRERNLSCWVLEKDVLASTIRDYPKHKHVMAEPHHVPLVGSLWFDGCTKEELLERWRTLVDSAGLPIREQTEVQGIEQQGELFSVKTGQGSLLARAVMVCIGKRGAPRNLGVPGESPLRVRYVLIDPDEWANRQVLVVGGGDSALEAAVSLAEIPGCHVTLSYRRDSFTRAKSLNRARLQAAQQEGSIRVELKSTVSALEPGRVRLRTEQGEISLANDVVFAFLGTDPPTDFLAQARIQVLEPGSAEMADYAKSRGLRQRAIKCDHCRDFDRPACLGACPTGALFEATPAELFTRATTNASSFREPPPRLTDTAFLRGPSARRAATWGDRLYHPVFTGLILLTLAGLGVEVFLRSTQPEASLSAWLLRAFGVAGRVDYSSGRGLGHWLGYVGASAMLLSTLYSLRTRVQRCNGWGKASVWMSAHQWLGFIGGTLVTYHSALKLDRWASIACFLIWIVVATGILGRYAEGRAKSAINLVDFERRARSRRRGLGLERLVLTIAHGTLRHWNIVHIVLAIAMFVLAGIHIVYGFVYKAV
ncbi:MAG: NAD(P)-binding domain-containing protein [Polyangiaceae bacterium]|nr:NAD(P)-binding domain-containing protein [Polyangiaceae bacterium]